VAFEVCEWADRKTEMHIHADRNISHPYRRRRNNAFVHDELLSDIPISQIVLVGQMRFVMVRLYRDLALMQRDRGRLRRTLEGY